MLQAVVDGGLSIAQAIERPRLDASGERLIADNRLAPELLAALAERGWDVLAVEESAYPRHFASPAGRSGLSESQSAAVDSLMPSGVAAL